MEIWEFYAWDIGDPSLYYWRNVETGLILPGIKDGPDVNGA